MVLEVLTWESFYHSVYGITPYVPPNNLAPVVAQNTTVGVSTSASANAVFSHAVFTSLILMSVTSGLNQDTVLRTRLLPLCLTVLVFMKGKKSWTRGTKHPSDLCFCFS